MFEKIGFVLTVFRIESLKLKNRYSFHNIQIQIVKNSLVKKQIYLSVNCLDVFEIVFPSLLNLPVI